MKELAKKYRDIFKEDNKYAFSCGGRFEILGNHTDHNHGLCLAATCNLAITALVTPKENQVRFYSEGFNPFFVDINDLSIHEEEINHSPSLVRGVARYLKDHGYNIGGFDAYSVSNIFKGAGVSSSAAFELLVAEIFNSLYNDDSIPKIVLAKAGQYAENVYFGKKSGLLDQVGVGFGNISYIDFKDIDNPKIETVDFPFKDLHFVIVNTGGSHADLSDLYSQIPLDMYNAAEVMGHKFLIEGSLEELEKIKGMIPTRAFHRALHFYGENERVNRAMVALKDKDEQEFLKCILGSRESSRVLLNNMMVEDQYEGSPLEATDLAMEIMEGEGACKINGGGFAGSIICVVPDKYLEKFLAEMAKHYGKENVVEIFVRETGPIRL